MSLKVSALPLSQFQPRYLPAMFTSNFDETRHLSQEEHILHHYAAIVKRDLQVNEQGLAVVLKNRLVFCLLRSIVMILSNSFRSPQ
jgi:hypothetical protein